MPNDIVNNPHKTAFIIPLIHNPCSNLSIAITEANIANKKDVTVEKEHITIQATVHLMIRRARLHRIFATR